MKSIPIKSNKKTVALGGIVIFLSDSVGTLLTSKRATNTVRYGVRNFRSKFNFKSAKSYTNGVKIKSPPTGDGMPSKKLFFQSF